MSDLAQYAQPESFQALLFNAGGINAKREEQLDFTLPSAQFFSLLVKALSTMGCLKMIDLCLTRRNSWSA